MPLVGTEVQVEQLARHVCGKRATLECLSLAEYADWLEARADRAKKWRCACCGCPAPEGIEPEHEICPDCAESLQREAECNRLERARWQILWDEENHAD